MTGHLREYTPGHLRRLLRPYFTIEEWLAVTFGWAGKVGGPIDALVRIGILRRFSKSSTSTQLFTYADLLNGSFFCTTITLIGRPNKGLVAVEINGSDVAILGEKNGLRWSRDMRLGIRQLQHPR